MIFVSALVLVLYAGLVAMYVAICSIGLGWALGATVVAVALIVSAIAYYTAGDGFFLRSVGLPTQAPPAGLEARVARLAALAELPVPRLLVVHSREANAFTVGLSPRTSSVVVTAQLCQRLDHDELDAVIAHELSHIANRDAALMTVAAVPRTIGHLLISGRGDEDLAIVLWFFIWPLGLPILGIGSLLTLAFSRTREFAADRGAAIITGQPEALMSALTKLAGPHAAPSGDLRAVEAFCIVPASSWRFELFMDHPPLEKRLARLAEMARELGKPVGPH
jgi:heat shock protein HtpX